MKFLLSCILLLTSACGIALKPNASDDPNSRVNLNSNGPNLETTLMLDESSPDLNCLFDPCLVQIGDHANYIVEVQNTGNTSASAVQLLEFCPAGTTFVSATPSIGTYDSVTGIWDIGSVAATQVITMDLECLVTGAPGDIIVDSTTPAWSSGATPPSSIFSEDIEIVSSCIEANLRDPQVVYTADPAGPTAHCGYDSLGVYTENIVLLGGQEEKATHNMCLNAENDTSSFAFTRYQVPGQPVEMRMPNGTTIDWGDGTSDVLSDDTYHTLFHDYGSASAPACYEITITAPCGPAPFSVYVCTNGARL